MTKTIETTWDIFHYDVWGNEEDGFEVNDSWKTGTETVYVRVDVNNRGTPHEFESAELNDNQIRELLGIKINVGISVGGDDLHYYIDDSETQRPLGELRCTSHKSLSPIRKD